MNNTYIQEKLKEYIKERFNVNNVHFDTKYGISPKELEQLMEDAIKYGEEQNKDTQRLDFLDKMNKGLNKHYGTEYGWELILNHNVCRLFSGNLDRIDLNDAEANGAKSCRVVIDEAIAKLTSKEGEE